MEQGKIKIDDTGIIEGIRLKNVELKGKTLSIVMVTDRVLSGSVRNYLYEIMDKPEEFVVTTEEFVRLVYLTFTLKKVDIFEGSTLCKTKYGHDLLISTSEELLLTQGLEE